MKSNFARNRLGIAGPFAGLEKIEPVDFGTGLGARNVDGVQGSVELGNAVLNRRRRTG